ncbi:MAG: glycosyltransferase family 4 protein [Candidatus Kerfeldbacteria bacterium]|nr:glycosyltransferase family 4 protein [Candidatus Kerfeldbacteria bacterium]
MRIGIDCRTILNPGRGEQAGIGHYTYYLVKSLLKLDRKNEYVLFFDSRMDRDKAQEFEQSKVKVKFFPFSQYRRFLPVGYSHLLITGFLMRERLDLFHAPATSLPLTYRGKAVVTVHDLAIYKHPKLFPGHQFLSTRLVVPRSIKRAKRIIAVSEATKRDVRQLFRVAEKRIQVIYEGFVRERAAKGVVNVREKYGLMHPYLSFVGTIEPRKNLPNLIKGFASVANLPSMKKVDLILAGAPGWKYGDVIKAIKDAKLGSRVRYLGYLPHHDKLQLIEQSLAFVFPSLYEGFGLPVLEAMSLGTPVITSRVSALPEIAGTAAVFVNPHKFKEIGQAIAKVVGGSTLRKKLIAEGQRRSAMFTWDATARETLRVYREVGEKRKI